jgi:protoporphyrinogen oxidase
VDVGIVGGGFTGLQLACYLSKAGHRVDIFERESQPGGLATYMDYGEFYWDRFYHVILPTDLYLITFLEEIGLRNEIIWHESQTGFFVNDNLYSLSNNRDFLFFPPLSVWSKFRLAVTILYASVLKNSTPLEQITAENWLKKVGGEKTYEKFWKPLLTAKLGENYHRVSAVFIWTYIKRLYSARDAVASREKLGHVRGGYKKVLDRIENILIRCGTELHYNSQVDHIGTEQDQLFIHSDRRKNNYDRVVFTAPTTIMSQVVSPELVNVRQPDRQVEYLGVICPVLVTDEPLVPFYVVNIADARVPFTGIIGMSSVVDPNETGGYYTTYLPKYVHSGSDEFDKPDEVITDEFLEGLKIIFPEFQKKSIRTIHVNSARFVQPLQVTGYSQLIPELNTKHPHFYVLNSSQFTENTLNNNTVSKHVRQFLRDHAAGFSLDDESVTLAESKS